MFDIGVQEVLVIMVLALLVFGPDKLPELGRRLGRAMREFRRASDEFRRTVETNLNLDEYHAALPPSAAESPSLAADPPPSADVAPQAGAATQEGVAVSEATGPALTDEVPAGEPSPGAQLEPFWTSRGGHLLHRSTCPWRSRIQDIDRVSLKTASDGWDLGLVACPVCDPREAVVTS